jgi:hypothetical protein
MATETDQTLSKRSIWHRGLLMFVFAVLFGLAEAVLIVITLIQFFWAAITGAPNAALRDFGAMMSEWLREVGQFQTFNSEEAPYPWGDWPKDR